MTQIQPAASKSGAHNGAVTPTASGGFRQFPLSPGTLDAIAGMGYEEPSPIQLLAIPHLLQGKDMIGQARTGTGKTSAFGIPLIDAARTKKNAGIVSLVLVPTRELAIQVADELTLVAKGSGVRTIAVYGGVGYGKQNMELRRGGTIILVATPGRLLDHIQQGSIRMPVVTHLVLDEADRMLDMGFLPDVERILRAVPAQRQTMLFSATMPDPIRRLSERFLKNPVTVRVEVGPEATPNAEQFQIRMEKSMKTRALLALLEKEKPERGVIFTRTKHLAKRLAHSLERSGHKAVALQGNMSQGQRERAMASFRTGEVHLMVATDIVSRGIDIPEMTHVINYDLPDEPEAYVHRIGRTGRMGRTGRAFTFVQSDEVHDMKRIERMSPTRINPFELGDLPPEPPAPARSGPSDSRFGGGHPSHPGHHAKKHPEGEDGERPRYQGGYGGRSQGGRSGGRSGSFGGGGGGRPGRGGGYRGRRY